MEANRGQETGNETGTETTGSPGPAEEVGPKDDPETGRKTGSRNRLQAEEGCSGSGRKTEGRGTEASVAEACRAQVGREGRGAEAGRPLEAR